tara:strand:- start:1353 stop:1604 length:252 start_codon:yes stop_codon:yes gene_type:complete
MQQTHQQFVNSLDAYILKLAQKIGTHKGFFEYWFKILPLCKNYKAAFDIVNFLHFKIFGVEKYTSYSSFHNQKTRYLKTLKNG